ncbi:MAG: dihydropteroate synthase, partial [Opitutales bacterium]|nr:dihydropteroate synthase [Opitutales bacterium]
MNWKSPHSRALPSPSETPLIMGILNVGKYSFSDGGKFSEICSAVRHVEDMIAQGADIIDIGAESTRPNAAELSLDDEIEILLPRLKAVRKAFANIPISVDTYKPEVARIAISEGADIINDVYAIRKYGKYLMAQVAAEVKAPLIVTHSCRGEIIEGNFFDFFIEGMQERIQSVLVEGVSSDMIIVDVGIGFGKTIEQNFELIRRLDEVKKMG